MPNVTEELYRPGLEGIIAGETNISAVKQDSLMYRGYAIEELAEHSPFEEVAWLILRGELPTRAQLDAFKHEIDRHRRLPGAVIDLIHSIPPQVGGMDVLRTAVSMCGHFEQFDSGNVEHLHQQAAAILGVVPSIIGARVRPREGLSHAAQTLWLAFGKEPGALEARILNLTYVLYAEHEFNASAFACRVTASTLSDIWSAMVTGIGTLKGPLHGGANEETIHLINRFKTAAEARDWAERAIAEKQKISGFGHRVYKNGDHRARILEKEVERLAEGRPDRFKLDVYFAIKNTVFERKKIHMNVDYPCGLAYFWMGLPVDIYTPLFVASRVSGWAAHYIEQVTNNRIIRPLSRYTGPAERKYVPIERR
jgi:citrate synthase